MLLDPLYYSFGDKEQKCWGGGASKCWGGGGARHVGGCTNTLAEQAFPAQLCGADQIHFMT